MMVPPCRFLARALIAGAILLTAALASPAHPVAMTTAPLTLDDLQRMNTDQLLELFKNANLGRPFQGVGDGRVVNLTDGRLPGLKMRLANCFWKGKEAQADGAFVNRWIGGVRCIGSTYTVGPSWIDGKEAMLIDYPINTPLLWNMHDELREVAPGLYLGPFYDRFPCPKFRGFLAVQLKCGCCGK